MRASGTAQARPIVIEESATIDAVDEWTKPGLAMKNGVAMVIRAGKRRSAAS